MKKYYLIIIIVSVIISLSIFLLIHFNELARWNGWNAISAISTFLASIGISIFIYQLAIQKRSYNIDELNYVMGLTDRFVEANKKYDKAWIVLREYGDNIPKQMTSEDWDTVVEALTNCYESAYLNFQVAQLVENQIIDLKTFYMLQFNFLSEDPDEKLDFLYRWIETGADLAANYNYNKLYTMAKSAKIFYKKLYQLSKQSGVEGYDYQIESIEEIENELLKNYNKYNLASPHYSYEKMIQILK